MNEFGSTAKVKDGCKRLEIAHLAERKHDKKILSKIVGNTIGNYREGMGKVLLEEF
jgi:hypothetical protein